MDFKMFNDKIAALRAYYDLLVFELKTKNMDSETVLTVKHERRGYELVEIHFSNFININSRIGFDQLGFSLKYEWANYDENDMGEDERNTVKSIINTFKDK